MWPEYFPQNCPPEEAAKADLTVFRLADSAPPTSADFIPTVVLTPSRLLGVEQLCLGCGLSVHKESTDAFELKKRYKPLREKVVVQVRITPEDGVVMKTGSGSHHTWWIDKSAIELKFGASSNDLA
jgi:hypothetical protein